MVTEYTNVFSYLHPEYIMSVSIGSGEFDHLDQALT